VKIPSNPTPFIVAMWKDRLSELLDKEFEGMATPEELKEMESLQDAIEDARLAFPVETVE
jgi:hypothetical protein